MHITERRFHIRVIHIYTGQSKGKTTASVGLAVRAMGAGMKVLFVSYFKPDGSSEHGVLEKLGAKVLRFTYRGNFFKRYNKEQLTEAKKAFAGFFVDVEAETPDYDLIIHDEVVYAVHMGLTTEQKLLDYLDLYKDKEIVLTGRDFPEKLIQRADYVTEMQKVKHPFDKGAQPRKGIEH